MTLYAIIGDLIFMHCVIGLCGFMGHKASALWLKGFVSYKSEVLCTRSGLINITILFYPINVRVHDWFIETQHLSSWRLSHRKRLRGVQLYAQRPSHQLLSNERRGGFFIFFTIDMFLALNPITWGFKISLVLMITMILLYPYAHGTRNIYIFFR